MENKGILLILIMMGIIILTIGFIHFSNSEVEYKDETGLYDLKVKNITQNYADLYYNIDDNETFYIKENGNYTEVELE